MTDYFIHLNVQVDQAHLETVIPSVGGAVCILKGADAGSQVSLEAIDVENFRARVKFESGQQTWMEYEDICKIDA